MPEAEREVWVQRRAQLMANLTNLGKGRKPGSRPKAPPANRDMLNKAIRDLGGTEWFVALARQNPGTFASLASKVIEKDLDTDARRMGHEEWLDAREKALNAWRGHGAADEAAE